MTEVVERAADYEFELPPALVAQEPPEARGGERTDARLAVLHRESGQVDHRRFSDLGDYLRAGDVLVLNNARVVPSLLEGVDADGEPVAVSLHSPVEDGTWHCLVAPTEACSPGAEFRLGGDGDITVRLLHEADAGVWRAAVDPPDAESLQRAAEMICPGYLDRAPLDPEQYQTVYASRPGAVLLPSAGRHFTPEMLDELRAAGVAVAEVTLYLAARSRYFVRMMVRRKAVREGLPVREDLDDAPTGFDLPRAERYEVSADTADLVNRCRRDGGRVVVCGTSAMRTLETVADSRGRLWPQTGFTQLTIMPGHVFRACDAFMTNLHRPMSSELLLTAAFAGRETLLKAYRDDIIANGYLFHEFGDSMLIV